MCLIITKSRDNKKLPDTDFIRNGYSNNQDGMGMMYTHNGKIIIKKDFTDIDDLIKHMYDNVTCDDDLVIHFRYATSGTVDEGNSHPFPITKNKQRLRLLNLECKQGIAHNGVISKYSFSKTKFSDTQKFVMDIIASSHVRDNLDDHAIQLLIKSFIGNDKLAILDHRKGMILIGDYVDEPVDGCRYSNTGYLTANKFSNFNLGKAQNWYNEYCKGDIVVYKDYTYAGHCGFCHNWDNQTYEMLYKGNESLVCPDCMSKIQKPDKLELAYCEYCSELFQPDDIFQLDDDTFSCKDCIEDIYMNGKRKVKKLSTSFEDDVPIDSEMLDDTDRTETSLSRKRYDNNDDIILDKEGV